MAIKKFFKKIRQKAFTLTETIVMITIILILTGIIIIATEDSRALARDKKRIAHFAAYKQALARYYSKHKEFPNPKPSGEQGEGEACSSLSCQYNPNIKICTCRAEYYLTMLKDEGLIDEMMADPKNDLFHWYSYNVDDAGQNYKLTVLLEKDITSMREDGGTCPGSWCPSGFTELYEVYSTLGAHLAFGYWGVTGKSTLACEIVPGTTCPSEKPLPVLRLSNPTTNAHAALVNSGSSYSNILCCSGPADLSVKEEFCSPGEICSNILTLSSSTNAHVGDRNAYSNSVSFKRSGGIVSCSIKSGCDSNETCLVSISDNSTNAHIGNCKDDYSPYSYKVCCKAPSAF